MKKKSKSESGPPHYSVVDAAEYLSLHPSSIYTMIETGRITYRRKGPRKGTLFFLQADLDAQLEPAGGPDAKKTTVKKPAN